MAVATDTLEIVNILVAGDVPRESAEALATILAERFSQAATEDQLSQQLALEREQSDARFDAERQRSDARFDAARQLSDARFDAARQLSDARFAELMSEMNARFAQVDARFSELEAKIYRAVAAGTALILAAISVWAAFG